MEEMFKLKFKCLTPTPYTQKEVTKVNINLSFETPASPMWKPNAEINNR